MTYRGNLEIQVEEMEMIKSIFSQPGEFREDRDSCAAVIAYVKEGYELYPPPLVYSLNLTVGEVKLEMNITLPTSYPSEKPNVFLRNTSTSLVGNLNVTELKNNFEDYMSNLESGETCIYQLIMWLQENVTQFYSETKSTGKCVLKDASLSRYWIYSHHIYSKNKRKDILNLASKTKLTGFILPGRPGLICLEGYEQDCRDTWAEIRQMNWQKIILKTEEKDCTEPRKFDIFKEVCFEGCSNSHMDMGKFLVFLREHECEHIFKEYFGCDGQITDNA